MKHFCDLSILDTSNWPSAPGIWYGESQVTRLCRRFNLCEDQAVNGIRDFLEHPYIEPKSLKPLIRCRQTIPCSSECDRGFSLVNNGGTDKRSTILLSIVNSLMMMISISGPPVSHGINMAEKPSLCHASKEAKHTSDA